MTDTERILSAMGFSALTPMQTAMGEAGRGRGAVALLSPTGSGKTLAYLLPLAAAVDSAADTLQAVVITPTRELAAQSEETLRRMKTPLRSVTLHGGRPAMDEHRRLREVKPQVVFATPGRLNDHLAKGNISGAGVRTLVMDEFDKCLELGFQAEMEQAVAQFPRTERQWLLSATDAEEIPAFMHRLAPRFERLDFLSGAASPRERTTVYSVPSPKKDKLGTLGALLTHIKGEAAIVFVSYRESAERVGKWLRGEGFTAEIYHGGMEQEHRERALYKFRCGAANVLVCTDLAARGLDIPEVRAVIHYHLPAKEEDYTHRNGRTARWDADGAVYLIVGPEETLPAFADDAETLALPQDARLRPTPPRYASVYIGRGKRDKLSKGDVLGFLCKKGGLRSEDLGRIDVHPHCAYASVLRQNLAPALRAVAGEKIKGMKTIVEEMRN